MIGMATTELARVARLWDAQAVRACTWCTHGRAADGAATLGNTTLGTAAATCICPAVRGTRASVPVAEARSHYGPCGPEATHQSLPGVTHADGALRHIVS